MSYILEVLKKTEQQKRMRESGPGSWVDDLTREPAKTASTRNTLKRFIVAFSILFIIFGISTGLYLSQRSNVHEEIVKQEATVKTESSSKRIPEVRNVEPEISLEPIEKKSPPKGITLSEAATLQAPEADLQNRNSDTPSIRRKDSAGKTEKVLPFPESRKTVDLTNKFKLTSTGTSATGRYASIDGATYYLGDEFEGMILTKIQRDRVFLKEKNGWQQFKIVFRYKK